MNMVNRSQRICGCAGEASSLNARHTRAKPGNGSRLSPIPSVFTDIL